MSKRTEGKLGDFSRYLPTPFVTEFGRLTIQLLLFSVVSSNC